MIRPEQLHARVMQELDMTREIEDEELTRLIFRVLSEASREEYLSLEEKSILGRELFNAFRKLDLLQEFLEDEEITEIMINGTQNIFYEKKGRILQSDRRFLSREKLEDVIQQIVAGANRLVNEASPIVDARLSDGSRVNVVLAPVAINGPIVTIRKFSSQAASMEQLIAWDSLSQEVAGFLGRLTAAGYNIFISGGTGSGKTTFLNALSQYIPSEERIITIEDSAELKLQGIPNLVRLEARNANVEGSGEITIRDLIKAALRMRPDRIIIGEVRSAEAIDMLQALNTGHDGSLSTGHANSPSDMLARLETMVLMGMEMPLSAVRRQIASGVDVIVHLGRLRDKSRKLLEVAEVLGYEEGEIRLQTLYRFEERWVQDGRIQGEWRKCHEITHQEKLLAAGYQEMGVELDGNKGGGDHAGNGMAVLPLRQGCTLAYSTVDLLLEQNGKRVVPGKGISVYGTVQRSDPVRIGIAEYRIFRGERIPGSAKRADASVPSGGPDIQRNADSGTSAASADTSGAGAGRIG